MIEQLQNKQREKEAEIVVLKYALLEMDRKFTELEKKTKTTGTGVARTGAGAASRTTGMAGKTGTGSSMTTPRGSSRATGATSNIADARARSKTPTAGRMQNNLNTSVTSKTTAAGRDSNIGGKSTTRGDSKSRNTELQSQTLKKAGALNSQRQARQIETSNTRAANVGSKIGGGSRASSRQGGGPTGGRENSVNNSTIKRGNIGGGSRGGNFDNSFSARQSDAGLNHSHIQDPSIQSAQFGKVSSNIYIPDKIPANKKDINSDLKLAYVPTYNGKNARNNIFFVDKENIVFFSSTVAVIMNINTYEQQILQGHSDEIVCMSYEPLNKLLVTAQQSSQKDRNPFFIVWDLKQRVKLVTGSCYQKSILQIQVDESGQYVVTIGQSQNSSEKTSIALWAIKDFIEESKKQSESSSPTKHIIKGVQPRAEIQISKFETHQMRIDPLTSSEKVIQIYCGTDRGVRHFTLNAETRMIDEANLPEQLQQLRNVHDIQFVDEEVYFGSDDGSVTYMMLNRISFERFEVDGASSVQSLGVIGRSGGNVLIVLTEDSSKILIYGYKILNEQFEIIDQDILTRLGSENLKLQPKACCAYDNIVVIGFEQNTIIKYNLDTNQREVIISGPFTQPQFIAPHPKHKVFAVIGYDKFLRLYSYGSLSDKSKNCLINSIELQNEAKSCDFSPNGKFFCLGYQNGVFEVFQLYDNDGDYFQIECLKLFDLNRKYPVQCVKFSPDGRYLTISCHKDLVVFSAQSEDFDQEGLLKGNTQTHSSII